MKMISANEFVVFSAQRPFLDITTNGSKLTARPLGQALGSANVGRANSGPAGIGLLDGRCGMAHEKIAHVRASHNAGDRPLLWRRARQ